MNFEGFIDIRSRTFQLDRIGIKLSLENVIFGDIDYIGIIKSLKKLNEVGSNTIMELVNLAKETNLSNSDKLIRFLNCITRNVSMNSIYNVFCKNGQASLFDLITLKKYKSQLPCVQKKEVPRSRFAHREYTFFKAIIDNNCFNGDPRVHLKKLDDMNISSLNDTEPIEAKQKLLEKNVVLKTHRVQLYGGAESGERYKILKEMNEIRTDGLDRTSLELTYFSKMAVTAIKNRKVDETQRYIDQVLALCYSCLPCFATVMALNDVIYANQEMYFLECARNPHSLIRATDHSLLACHIMCAETDIVHNQWKRIVLLFKVMTLLDITHEFKVGDIADLEENRIKEAKVVIKEVVKICTDIEVRRKMVLLLCQGRLEEKNDPQIAFSCVEEAFRLAPDGCIRPVEMENIDMYLNCLKAKCMPLPNV